MTPEEQRVIDTSLALDDDKVLSAIMADKWEDYRLAVRALRESRKPKPKWVLNGTFIEGSNGCLPYAIRCCNNDLRQRVLDLLNKADPA